MNVPEANIQQAVRGKAWRDLSGFEAVACMQRSDLELGRSWKPPENGYVFPTKGRCTNG